MKKKPETVESLIESIKQRLDSMEDLMPWLCHASLRFRKGQRVEFSPSAHRNGLAPAKGGATRGTVMKVEDPFNLTVHIDGYKRPSSFHHGHFQPIMRKVRS